MGNPSRAALAGELGRTGCVHTFPGLFAVEVAVRDEAGGLAGRDGSDADDSLSRVELAPDKAHERCRPRRT